MTHLNKPQASRLHCLDWLRVIAIAVLVLYHIGMVYVPEWGYHFKNPLNGDLLQSFMLLTSPWRMGLLWLVSGMAFAHMCKGLDLLRLSTIRLAIKRSNQILLPLLVGILFIVPIQLFAEMKQAGDMPLGFSDFVYAFYVQPQQYFAEYASGIWPRFDVNHLWFLRSLWGFSMVLIILSPVLNTQFIQASITWLASRVVPLLLLFIAPIMAIELFFEGEAVREYYGFVLLLLGFCLGRQNGFWHTLTKHLKLLCLLSAIAMLALQIGFVVIWQGGLHQTNSVLNMLIECIYVANKILPLLAMFALAHRFLNTPNNIIKQLNPYVFPLYILHQSVIILVAYLATTSSIEVIQVPEFQIWINLLLTPVICATLLFFIARVNVLRVGFGMRFKNNLDPYKNMLTRSIVFIICLPMIIRMIT
jgi:hypothetical protein